MQTGLVVVVLVNFFFAIFCRLFFRGIFADTLLDCGLWCRHNSSVHASPNGWLDPDRVLDFLTRDGMGVVLTPHLLFLLC